MTSHQPVEALTGAQQDLVKALLERWDFQLVAIAMIIGTDENTLHRWLTDMPSIGPPRAYQNRLDALQELHTELRDAFATVDAVRRWLRDVRAPALSGRTPIEVLLEGKIEQVTGLLWNLNNGMMS